MDVETATQELKELYEECEATYSRRAYDELTSEKSPQSRRPVMSDFCELGESVLESLDLLEENYETQIRTLHEICEQKIQAELVAATVGCSVQYARRFAYDDGKGAYEKEWSKSTQKQKVSPGTRTKIIDRDSGACLRCGSTANIEVHHILPVSRGGTKEDSNLATLCSTCHQAAHGGAKTVSKTAYEPDEFDAWLETPLDRIGDGEHSNTNSPVQRELSDFS